MLRQLEEAEEARKLAVEENKEAQSQFAKLKTRAYEAERSQTDNVLKISSLEKEVKEMKRDLTEFDEVKARLEESVREVNKELSFLQNKHDDSVREYEAQIKDYKSQLDGTSLIRIHVAVWIVCSVGTTCLLPLLPSSYIYYSIY